MKIRLRKDRKVSKKRSKYVPPFLGKCWVINCIFSILRRIGFSINKMPAVAVSIIMLLKSAAKVAVAENASWK